MYYLDEFKFDRNIILPNLTSKFGSNAANPSPTSFLFSKQIPLPTPYLLHNLTLKFLSDVPFTSFQD
jgi:hypothetical protein